MALVLSGHGCWVQATFCCDGFGLCIDGVVDGIDWLLPVLCWGSGASGRSSLLYGFGTGVDAGFRSGSADGAGGVAICAVEQAYGVPVPQAALAGSAQAGSRTPASSAAAYAPWSILAFRIPGKACGLSPLSVPALAKADDVRFFISRFSRHLLAQDGRAEWHLCFDADAAKSYP